MYRFTEYLVALAFIGSFPAVAMAQQAVPGDGSQDTMEMTGKAQENKKRGMDTEIYELTEEGTGDVMGSVKVRANPHGVLFVPELSGLTPGVHGFHLHENPDCGPSEKDGDTVPGGAAGGHYNPGGGGHNGPYQEGHKGDLPALYANQDGEVSVPVLAPRLMARDLHGRALIIHQNGDNYSDDPKPLGGGGSRVACGIIGEK